jgi:hypothetical protein
MSGEPLCAQVWAALAGEASLFFPELARAG